MKTVVLLIAATVLAVSFEVGLSPAADRASRAAAERVEQVAAELSDLFDLVLEKHVVPVTRQQMLQQCLAYGYFETGQVMPAALVKEISDTSDPNRIRKVLRRELAGILGRDANGELQPATALTSIGVHLVPTKVQRVNDQIAANRYVGIGIAIGTGQHEMPMMHAVFPAGPADRVGARSGDAIAEVDGKSTKGVAVSEIIDWLRGVEGSDVEVVLRSGQVERSVTMTRGVIPLKTVAPPLSSKSGETVGIKLDRVSASNVHELRRMSMGLDASVKTVVLDFRTDEGTDRFHYGELLGNALLDGGVLGFVSDNAGNRRRLDAEPGAIFSDRKLIVIINGKTSGVLKWIAAALQDSKQAILLGEPSGASALVTESIALHDALSVVLPVNILHRASGEPLIGSVELLPSRNEVALGQQRVAGSGVGQGNHPGTLRPDRGFLYSRSVQSSSVMDSGGGFRLQVRDLPALLEMLEPTTEQPVSRRRR